MNPNSTSTQRILVVDDEKNYRILLSRLLESAGYQVLVADSPVTAWKLLHREEISLVITDLCMPSTDAVSFCKQISAEYPAIPCIVFTAYSSRLAEQELKDIGVLDCIEKPFSNQMVLELVADVLAKKPSLFTDEQEVL